MTDTTTQSDDTIQPLSANTDTATAKSGTSANSTSATQSVTTAAKPAATAQAPIVSLSDAALFLATASTTTSSTTAASVTDTAGHTTTAATSTTTLPASLTTSPQRYTLRQPGLSHSTSTGSVNSLHSQLSAQSGINKLSTLGTAAKTIDEMLQKPIYALPHPVVEPVEETIAVDATEPVVDPAASVVVLDEVIRQEVVRCVCGKVHIEPINPAAVDAAATDPNSNLADPNAPVTNDNVSDAVVQCEGCLIWQHARCVGLTSLDSIPQEYYCDLCQPDSAIHQTRLKYEQMLMKLTPSKSTTKTKLAANGTGPTKLTPSKRQSYETHGFDSMSVDSTESKKQATQQSADTSSDTKASLTSVAESNGKT